jgi:hypothetical protein
MNQRALTVAASPVSRLKLQVTSLLYLLSLCFLAGIIGAFSSASNRALAVCALITLILLNLPSLPRWEDTLKGRSRLAGAILFVLALAVIAFATAQVAWIPALTLLAFSLAMWIDGEAAFYWSKLGLTALFFLLLRLFLYPIGEFWLLNVNASVRATDALASIFGHTSALAPSVSGWWICAMFFCHFASAAIIERRATKLLHGVITGLSAGAIFNLINMFFPLIRYHTHTGLNIVNSQIICFAIGAVFVALFSKNCNNGRLKTSGRIWAIALAQSLIIVSIIAHHLAAYGIGLGNKGKVIIFGAEPSANFLSPSFERLGTGNAGMYGLLPRYISARGYSVSIVGTTDELGEALDGASVLIIISPTTMLPAELHTRVWEFVKTGGSLLVMGDHTNLFGMSTYLNEVARLFGVRFNYDDTFDLASGQPSSYTRPALLYHPIERDLQDFGFQTSCTLDVPLLSEFVIIGGGLGREWVDYVHKNFFGNIAFDTDEDYGMFVQASALKCGKGRVVSFSDSTVFSNFSLFWPGKSELLLNALDYLNRRNRFGDTINLLSLGLGFIAVAALVFFMRRHKLGHLIPLCVVLGGIAFIATATAVMAINKAAYGKLKPHTPYTTVAFETEYSIISLVEKDALLSDTEDGQQAIHQDVQEKIHSEANSFRTFYVNLARLGVFPTTKSTLSEALSSGQIVVVINPGKPFSHSDQQKIHHFLQHGSKLLLMDSVTNNFSFTNQLLRAFNAKVELRQEPVAVSLRTAQETNETVANNAALQVGELKPVNQGQQRPYGSLKFPQLSIVGQGNPIFISKDQRIVAHEIRHGTGSIVIFVDSTHFSNSSMGPVFQKPDDAQLRAYKDMFFLFENYLLNRAPDARVAVSKQSD